MNGPPKTLLQMVLDGVAAASPDPILTFVEVGAAGELCEETRSFDDLLIGARAIAGALRGAGMAEQDAFAIIMRNHPEFVEAMIASEIAGTVFVPVDPRTRGEKLAYMG